jgi:hypothetical protein
VLKNIRLYQLSQSPRFQAATSRYLNESILSGLGELADASPADLAKSFKSYTVCVKLEAGWSKGVIQKKLSTKQMFECQLESDDWRRNCYLAPYLYCPRYEAPDNSWCVVKAARATPVTDTLIQENASNSESRG